MRNPASAIGAGAPNPTLARQVCRQIQRALDLLARGLGDYGVRAE